MKNNIKLPITVIIPSYNARSTIRNTLESVNNGISIPNEILIIDDHSSADLMPDYKALQADHSNLQVVKNQENFGVSKTRNIGIRLASNDLITFLDADDLYHKYKLTNEFMMWQKSSAEIIYSDIIHHYTYRKFLNRFRIPTSHAILHTHPYYSPRDMLISKDFIKKEGLFFREDMSLLEDWEWCIRLLQSNATWVSTKKPGTIYNIGSTGLSSQKPSEYASVRTKIFALHKKLFEQNFITLETSINPNFHRVKAPFRRVRRLTQFVKVIF